MHPVLKELTDVDTTDTNDRITFINVKLLDKEA